jgi:hypothetical protein
MKHLFTCAILAASVLLTAGCQDDREAGAADERKEAAVSEGSFVDPQPQEKTAEVLALCRDHWVFEYYVADDRQASLFNRGRWYIFQPDGTFVSGHWEEQTAKGSWQLEYSRDRTVVVVNSETGQPYNGKPYELRLHLDSNNDREDASYIIAFNPLMDISSWTGMPKSQAKGIAIKAINLIDRPTKKQFGLE